MLFLGPVVIALCIGQAGEPTSVRLFRSGKEGYPRYRIPSLLVTAKGTVLAICEGRKDGRGLTGDIDIVIKRSVDDGRTWKPLAVIADGGEHTLGNPCAVVDRRDGRIWLLVTRSHGKDVEDDIVAGTSREKTRVLVTSSKDDGLTWEPLRDITASAAEPSWRWYGTGPGIGIQLASSRLLIPAYHSEAGTRLYRSHALYSDDRGETWKRGDSTGEHASESQAIERADGSVQLNARTNDQGPTLRTVADSKDGGATWSKARHDPDLFDPHCQASIYRLTSAKDNGKTRWLFCHPVGPGRRNLTVRLSYNEGKSWPIARKVRDGDSQYSCMAGLRDGTIGLLHESWVDKNYQIYFVRFDLKWLTEGKDSLKAP